MSQHSGREDRLPAVSGAFYPSDPKTLREEVSTLLGRDARRLRMRAPGRRGHILALVAPHAGYRYSGAVAGSAYALLVKDAYDTVVVISPSHREGFDFTSIFSDGDYWTPLGRVEVDRALCRRLADTAASLRCSVLGHSRPTGSLYGEHALEVHLPFLQVSLSRFKLVPVVMGNQDPARSEELALGLESVLDADRSLIVASSDFYHGTSYRGAWDDGRLYADALSRFDTAEFERLGTRAGASACGAGAVVSAMKAATRMGARDARVVRYSTSADAGGGHDYVVGYLSGVLIRGGS